MSRILALIVLLSAPLCAQAVTLWTTFEDWLIEEERTLEGWRVLTDDTLIALL